MSKKQAVSSVKASAFAFAAVRAEFGAAGREAGFREEPFGSIDGHPLFALTRRTPGPRPRVFVSAGIHGDEPAPPLALLRLLEAGVFDHRANWFLCPLLNPTGLVAGTRENREGIDQNRDYFTPRSREVRAHVAWLEYQPRFDAAFCLHEDWEAQGFYLYELNALLRPSLAPAVLRAVSTVCPIDQSELVDGFPASAGIIRPGDDPALRENWPEAIYLRAYHTSLSYTLESPSALPLEQRIQAQMIALTTALRLLTASFPSRATRYSPEGQSPGGRTSASAAARR